MVASDTFSIENGSSGMKCWHVKAVSRMERSFTPNNNRIDSAPCRPGLDTGSVIQAQMSLGVDTVRKFLQFRKSLHTFIVSMWKLLKVSNKTSE